MLTIHKGSTRVTRDELKGVPTPEATASYVPVPHSHLLARVEGAVSACGLDISSSEYAIWGREGERFFGILTLEASESGDYAATIGVRNGHDRSLSAALAIGSRVFCCDNLAFSSEVVIKTRHTPRIMERLPHIVGDGVARLVECRKNQDARIAAYKTRKIDDVRYLHDLVIRLYRAAAIPSTAIATVIEEFETPRHAEFIEPNLWSLMNATTETLKGFGFAKTQARTQRMHAVLDSEIASELLTA